ncbi:hypothetical protein [Paenibacillus sp. Marseille-Q4541]|uniref:hypothetical protein n=1 Tax=Paenibacillus sp. Marseille-Q4541 TaxID=2831522 RepID=UPI002019D9BA|nr:hypothetical protein [Paenibacillus sp. Marseille-Q4541]
MLHPQYPYETFIRTLPVKSQYTKEELLVEDLLVGREGPVEMYYAPHNEYINPLAKVVLVGITPGWTQMELAYRTTIQSLQKGETFEEACKAAKIAARFAGSMRTNIIKMLEDISLHHYLGIESVSDLFDANCSLLHTTSLLKHPVFVSRKNYNGHSPSLSNSKFLCTKIIHSFPQEMSKLEHPLIIPLGRSVEMVLRQLPEQTMGQGYKYLWGFPHPSGANGHRLKQFESAKPEMIQLLSHLKGR